MDERDEAVRLHASVSGRVQGVNFRYYTEQAARQLGIVGWVRNLPDRSVEVVAEGTQAQLDELVTFLHQGSPEARVDRVETQWQTATGEFENFSVNLIS